MQKLCGKITARDKENHNIEKGAQLQPLQNATPLYNIYVVHNVSPQHLPVPIVSGRIALATGVEPLVSLEEPVEVVELELALIVEASDITEFRPSLSLS